MVGDPAPSDALANGNGILGLSHGGSPSTHSATTTPSTLVPVSTTTVPGTAGPTGTNSAGPTPGAGVVRTGAVASPGSSTKSPIGAPLGLTASDVGVTATTIKVGIPIPELANLGQLGNTEGDPQLQWQAFIANQNAHGGILGRQIVPVYVGIDLTSADSLEQACINMTEQQQVFAVLQSGGYFGAPILCLTQQHHTPFIGQSSGNDYYYQESNGLFFSISPDNDRAIRNQIVSMQKDGDFTGKTIAILDDGGDDSLLVNESLLPALQAAGYKVSYRVSLSSDASTAESQIPVAIQQMQSDGVNLVLPVASLVAADLFAQEADADGYHPTYVLSDVNGGATDNYALYMPASFDGNIGYTSLDTGEFQAGQADGPQDAACAAIYTAETGKTLSQSNEEYATAVTACGILNLFVKGATNAGANLTRAGLSQGMQKIGSFAMPYGSTGSFGPGKFDAPASTRKVIWRYNCKCWLPDGPFTANQY
ncbi:MAG TPA: ABC transporter substrate-binding protein [Acidimicrobiales bacterium]|nr:ABC transporter substrate-binding protein [Acidimicrobiales bacterium]